MRYEDLKNAKTTVWWDCNNCGQLPKGYDGASVLSTICNALTAVGCCEGPVCIIVCGDIYNKLPRDVLQALFKSDITLLRHVSSGSSTDPFSRQLPMMYGWANNADAPCNCMLISGESDYSDALKDFRTKNVNVLVAHPDLPASKDLTEAADHVWLWDSLLAGEPPYKSIPAAAAAPSLDDPSDKPEPEPKKSSCSSPSFFFERRKGRAQVD